MAAELINISLEESPGSIRAKVPLERAVGVTQRKVPQRRNRPAPIFESLSFFF